MSDVINLSKETNNGMLRTPEQMLEEALNIVRDPDDNSNFKHADKMLIISVNTENDTYALNWMQAGMKMSECITACEIAKLRFASEMEHIVTPDNIDEFC